MPVFSDADMIARAVSTDVAGWAGCALTTTGQPAASADAVSPPATENTRGILHALKNSTDPSGISIQRISGLAAGFLSGSARSMRASTQEPSRMSVANTFN